MMTLFLLLLLVGTGVHYLSFDPAKIDTPLEALTSLTNYAELSLGRAYDEATAAQGNIAYPEMQAIDRMDFVYVE
jgi:hypothetical protein